jgi:hypothetical protein
VIARPDPNTSAGIVMIVSNVPMIPGIIGLDLFHFPKG